MHAILDPDNLQWDAEYESDDNSREADLVSTALHSIQLTQAGGNDDDERVINVSHMIKMESLILTCE